jgi:hypothetical protein
LAFRRKWRRQVGNDKTARVAVPVGEDKPTTDSIHDDRDETRDGTRGEVLRLLSALEGAISTAGERKQADAATIAALREQLASSVALIDGFRDERDRERARADRAELGSAAERSRADALRDRLDAAQSELVEQRIAAEQANAKATDAQDAADSLRRAQTTPGRRGGACAAPGTVGGGDSVPAADDLRRAVRRAAWRPRGMLRGIWARLREWSEQ